MVKRALDAKILRELRQLRSQVLTIALLVICGISLMVGTRISYESLRESRDSFYRDYKFAELFAEFQAAPRSLANTLRAVPGVKILDEKLVTEGLIEVAQQAEPAVGRLISIAPGTQPRLNQIFVRRGRLPQEAQTAEVIIHEGFASAHQLDLGDSIKALVKGHRIKLQIVGIGLSPEYVYALHSGLPLPDDLHFGVFWLTEPTLARLMRQEDSFNSISVILDGTRSADLVKQDLNFILGPYGNRGVYDRDRLPSSMFVDDELTEQRTMSIISPMIFLSIAVFLIHVILSRLIHTHRPQIAVLKAIGFFDREIAWHYIKLIVVMMLFGTIPACGLGVWLGQLIVQMYENFFRFPELFVVIQPWTLALAFFIGIASGVLGGFAAIRSILRLPPAEALKPPVPPSYHAIFLDSLGLKGKLSITNRMTWRNLMLRPGRLGLTILGMAAALAIMISSGSLRDMVNFLMQAQFQHIQREDIGVSLQRPVSISGLQEMAGLPGVLKVEGYRATGVRLHYEHRQKETALMGWPTPSELRQRLNPELQSVPMPEQGIFLSRFFQTEWHIEPGDVLEVEILEGSFPRKAVTVAGFSDDLVGTAVHMRIEDLWRLLGEKSGYNFLCLKVDPTMLHSVYLKLNQYPLVSTLTLRSSLYKGFNESMGGLLQFSTALLIGFAFIIAIGLIYNTVMMNFSERSREIATLRVLGFDNIFLFLLLMDVVMIQVFLCLIPGCILGYKITEWLTGSMRTDTLSLPTVVTFSTYAVGIATMLLALIFSAWSLYRLLRSQSLTEALKAKE